MFVEVVDVVLSESIREVYLSRMFTRLVDHTIITKSGTSCRHAS